MTTQNEFVPIHTHRNFHWFFMFCLIKNNLAVCWRFRFWFFEYFTSGIDLVLYWKGIHLTFGRRQKICKAFLNFSSNLVHSACPDFRFFLYAWTSPLHIFYIFQCLKTVQIPIETSLYSKSAPILCVIMLQGLSLISAVCELIVTNSHGLFDTLPTFN